MKWLLIAAFVLLSGFTCSRNIPEDGRHHKESSNNWVLIGYKGTDGFTVSRYNTQEECEELKVRMEEKNKEVVYRCREER